MKYFTADTHFGDDRIGINGKPNLFYRPFNSLIEQNETIKSNFYNCGIKNVAEDEFWHLGDVFYDENHENILKKMRDRFPKTKWYLVVGNYDEDKIAMLEKYFDFIWEDGGYIHLFDNTQKDPYLKVCLNHYPTKCKQKIDEDVVTFGNKPISFALTGHIHSLWKVQKQMINVGVDAWHFKPVNENEILFCWTAMQKIYDQNAFPY